MVTVHIWEYRGKSEAWGHASMNCSRSYISYWPAQPGADPSKLHPNIYRSLPLRFRTFEDDVRDEQQRPDHEIRLEGLDEAAIEQWWGDFSLNGFGGRELHGPPRPWSTLDLNCSTVVATALKQGGGDRFASWASSWSVVWTPESVKRFAMSIRSNLPRRGRGA